MDFSTMQELRDPAITLEAFGTILDQRTGEIVPYDSGAIAPYLQASMLDFVGNTPRDDDGNKKWLAVLASRQVGKSATAALATYIRTAYYPGTYSAIITDTKERSEDLFRTVLSCHEHMPDEVRVPTIPNPERRQITFGHNGKIRTLSAQSNMVGIGRAFDALQISEPVFMPNAPEMWTGILPAAINRAEASILLECTPGPMSAPGAEWYRDICDAAARGQGRWQFLFAPFYSSLLNERTWKSGDRLTQYEIKLLEQFGSQGKAPESNPGDWRYLTLENLAFRRHILEMDAEIRRVPELFKVFFPTDAITCWAEPGGAAIPSHALERHIERINEMEEWRPPDGMYQEYEPPEPGAVYVIGADPAGYLGGDQAAFQVLKVYVEEVVQVATFSSNEVVPQEFARHLLEAATRYNDAEVVCESTGVGLATLSVLEMGYLDGVVLPDGKGGEKRYYLKNLYYHHMATKAEVKPGRPATPRTNAEGLAALIDTLMDTMKLNDRDTLKQLRSYRRDKEVAASDKWQILNEGKKMTGRRAKHHYDKVSALMIACAAVRRAPQRYKPMTNEQRVMAVKKAEEEAKLGMTQKQYEQALSHQQKQTAKRARKYARRRGKKRK
jgi:hypothetical protein